MARKKANARRDRRKFRKTSEHTRKINVGNYTPRGGIRL